MKNEEIPPSTLVEYPFPIRKGQIAYIKVPINLTKNEATKIYNYLITLTQYFEKE